jgi:hypothetical protein
VWPPPATPIERLRAPAMRALLGEARIPDGRAGILTRAYSGYLDPRQQIDANLRRAARLAIDGRWTDELDPAMFRAEYC